MEVKLKAKYLFKAPGTHKSSHNTAGPPRRSEFAGLLRARRTKHSFWTSPSQLGYYIGENHKVPPMIPQKPFVLDLNGRR